LLAAGKGEVTVVVLVLTFLVNDLAPSADVRVIPRGVPSEQLIPLLAPVYAYPTAEPSGYVIEAIRPVTDPGIWLSYEKEYAEPSPKVMESIKISVVLASTIPGHPKFVFKT
jgi:hypothetical protein